MKETNLNTIIANSLKYFGGIANKIPDPMHGTGIQNPFDGFGAILNKPLYWEAKLIKKDFGSFNFNIIEDHQAFYLTKYNDLIEQDILSLYIIGYYVPRQTKGIFIFDSRFINKYRSNPNLFNSIKKKDLKKLKDRYFIKINYISIDNKRKELIDLSDDLKNSFENKIITEEKYFNEIK